MSRLIAALLAVLCVIDIDEWGEIREKCADIQPEPPSIVRDTLAKRADQDD